jgi:glutathione S-transferase
LRRLVTIPISHFCEKARWALERARLEYREERHVQGIHRVASRRVGGKGTVPVLVAEDGVYAESEKILRYADARVEEEERLFPTDRELRSEVVAVSRRLDAGLGPDGRRLIYAHILPHKHEMLPVNNQGVSAWEDRAFRLLWPVARRWGERELSIVPTTIEDDGRRVREAFAEVAERLSDGRPYLCGDRFTAADLTFASLAAAVVVPPEYGVRLAQLEELPESIAADIREFREHPAGVFALKLFSTERRV